MKAVFSVLFLFLSSSVFSQKITARNAYHSTRAYMGIRNPIFYSIENYSCKSVSLAATHGTIEETGPCYFSFRPAETGDDTITFYKKGTKKRIGQILIEVRPIPDPVVNVGGKQGGSFIKGAFVAQGGIGAYADPSFGFDLPFTVVSFLTIVIRSEQIIFSRKTTGNAFDNELRTVFKSLEKNDRVVFYSILVKISPEEQRTARPLEFIIE